MTLTTDDIIKISGLILAAIGLITAVIVAWKSKPRNSIH